jgi:hypothetical protein
MVAKSIRPVMTRSLTVVVRAACGGPKHLSVGHACNGTEPKVEKHGTKDPNDEEIDESPVRLDEDITGRWCIANVEHANDEADA